MTAEARDFGVLMRGAGMRYSESIICAPSLHDEVKDLRGMGWKWLIAGGIDFEIAVTGDSGDDVFSAFDEGLKKKPVNAGTKRKEAGPAVRESGDSVLARSPATPR
jgi:hypothetical protein